MSQANLIYTANMLNASKPPKGLNQGSWATSPYGPNGTWPMWETLSWSEKQGLHYRDRNKDAHLGLYQQLYADEWRLRIKRRRGGHTWKRIPMNHPMMKRIRMEALLLGIQL